MEPNVLSASHCAVLRSAGTSRSYDRDCVMFHQGDRSDYVVLIQRGNVRVTTVAGTGYVSVLALRGAGDLVGEFASLDGRPRSATVTAIDRVDATTIAAKEFRAVIASSPDLLFSLLQLIVGRLREADRRRLEYGAYPAADRVALVLFDLAQQHGVPVSDEPGAITIITTQTEIAGTAGASRESVARAMRQLVLDGVVRSGRGRYVITDLHRLITRESGAS